MESTTSTRLKLRKKPPESMAVWKGKFMTLVFDETRNGPAEQTSRNWNGSLTWKLGQLKEKLGNRAKAHRAGLTAQLSRCSWVNLDVYFLNHSQINNRIKPRCEAQMKKQAEIKWMWLYRKVRWLQSIKQALRKMRNHKIVTTT